MDDNIAYEEAMEELEDYEDEFECDFRNITEARIKEHFEDKIIDECYLKAYNHGDDDEYYHTYIQIGGFRINWNKAKKDMKLRNFKYDPGYGLQNFGGFITFKDCDSWMERREYDGQEWWQIVKKPRIPNE